MILISACLLNKRCKYNGNHNGVKELIQWSKSHDVLVVCPEVLGGLDIPRSCCEIKEGKVINQAGMDLTAQYKSGANKVRLMAVANKVTLAVLKSKSPSCGIAEIYDGSFTHQSINANGVTAQMLINSGIKVISDEQWLNGYKKRVI